MAFEIEKDVPVPTSILYPCHSMSVGDSFLIPASNAQEKRIATNRASMAISYYRKKSNNGWRFITRAVDGGVRVWRIE